MGQRAHAVDVGVEGAATLSSRFGWGAHGRAARSLRRVAPLQIMGALSLPKWYYGSALKIAPDAFEAGQPVILMPGFTALEQYMRPMQKFLQQKGYDAHSWGGGANLGANDRTIRRVEKRLNLVFEKSSRAKGEDHKVTLVGHSLGGVIATTFAYDHPDKVDKVITMGSPLNFDRGEILPGARVLYDILSRDHEPMAEKITGLIESGPPEGVPVTCFYSMDDEVVSPEAAIPPGWKGSDGCEVVQCSVSHMEMHVSPISMVMVADRIRHGGNKPIKLTKYEAALG